LVYDGSKGFAYDDENQLIRITATKAWKSEFTYDGKMPRRIRKEFTWQNSAWVLTNEVPTLTMKPGHQERDAGQRFPPLPYTRGTIKRRAGMQAASAVFWLERMLRTDSTASFMPTGLATLPRSLILNRSE